MKPDFDLYRLQHQASEGLQLNPIFLDKKYVDSQNFTVYTKNINRPIYGILMPNSRVDINIKWVN